MNIAVSPDILMRWNSISFASGARPLYYPGNAAKHHETDGEASVNHLRKQQARMDSS